MKKVLKIFLVFIFCLMIYGLNKSVEANSINKISMDIYVDSNGTANVTETWNCQVNQGTECYHPYFNLGNSKIQNLSVTDNVTHYTTLNSWKTSGDLQSKAEKCGLNKTEDGVEICWGMTSYGTHKYVVQYEITNFVSELTDSQMIYWTLIPYEFSNPIGEVDIKIYSDFPIADTIDVWGYGNYGGLAYVDDGSIYMNSDGKLESSEYMTILVKFPSNTFETSNKLNHDFDYYFKMAEKGAKKYSKFATYIGKIIMFILFGLGFYKFVAWSNKEDKREYNVVKKVYPKNTIYYRDIPCNGDIFKIYYIAQQYKLAKKDTDILGAIILKWLKEGIIKVENRGNGTVFKKEDNVIILGDTEGIETKLSSREEIELFHMMHTASKDGILENKEFEDWCKSSYSRVNSWFERIAEDQRERLVKEGLVTSQVIGQRARYNATPALNEEAQKIAGLKKFLLEYTLIKDRGAIEVELFEKYLIIAQVLGIADQVQKQFKELYPDIIQQTNFNSYDNLIYISYCSRRGIRGADRGKQAAARAAAMKYSSGGGGFSSGGGGGGSFGGRRRRRRIPLKLRLIKFTKTLHKLNKM